MYLPILYESTLFKGFPGFSAFRSTLRLPGLLQHVRAGVTQSSFTGGGRLVSDDCTALRYRRSFGGQLLSFTKVTAGNPPGMTVVAWICDTTKVHA
jgi:hypothetical protein